MQVMPVAATWLVALGGAAVALVSAVILWWAWRGRRGGDEPYCRACGFDLRGKPEGVGRCSECGADLDARGAIVRGQRVRRWGGVAMAATALVPSLFVCVLGCWAAARATNFTPLKPTWWLRSEAFGVAGASRSAALAEINSRLLSGTLSDAEVTTLCRRVIALQADRSATWDVAWGDLVENARSTDKLSEADWLAYVRGGFGFTLQLRPTWRRGDPSPYKLVDDFRAGQQSSRWVNWRPDVEVGPANMSGGAIKADRDSSFDRGTMIRYQAGTSSSGAWEVSPGDLARLPDGPIEVRVRCRGNIYSRSSDESASVPPIVKGAEFVLTGTTRVLPADAEVMPPVRDPALTARIAGSVTVTRAAWKQGGRYLDFELDVRKASADFAFSIWARWNDRQGTPHERELTSFAMASGAATTWSMYSQFSGVEVAPGDRPSKLTLEFRPSPKAAVRTVDLKSYVDGTFTIDIDVAPEKARPSR